MSRKMKSVFIIISCLIITFFSSNMFVKADSGFDSSWDSGSSWDSSSSWDYDSSYDSSGSGNGEVGLISVIVFLVVMGIVIYSSLKSNRPLTSFDVSDDNDDPDSVKLLGDNFDFEQFYKQIFDMYKDVQIAWMNRDVEPVRNLLSDEMFNMYDMQIMTLKTKKQINMMEDIDFVKASVSKVEENNNLQTIYVKLVVTCRDYLVDEKTNKVLRGNKDAINSYTYMLTFTRNLGNSTLSHCPNCNAKLDNNRTNKCEYCGTIIQNNSSNYVLASKKMLVQYVQSYKKKKGK